MNKDLNIIKKKYGENMSKLCRDLFPTILEEEGVLVKLLLETFDESKLLYDDIINFGCPFEFKNYILNIYNKNIDYKTDVDKTPFELMDMTGYKLYKCSTTDEIKEFRKYYTISETICTITDIINESKNRLETKHVFFAVKHDVDDIKREDFVNPKRQDKYGTSVMSIQFDKGDTNNVLITNRYNYAVENPNATFSNNLENIVPGLSKSFIKEYNFNFNIKETKFNLKNYYKAPNNKFYKYNYKIGDVYYCPNNVLIKDEMIKKLDPSRYLIIDYFILDLKLLKIMTTTNDSFNDLFTDILKIEILNDNENKLVKISHKNHTVTKITLNKNNQMIKLESNNIIEIKDEFLSKQETLDEVVLSNANTIGNNFLNSNWNLKSIEIPEAKHIKDNFLSGSEILNNIDCKNVEYIGDNFLYSNKKLKKLDISKVLKINDNFMYRNTDLDKINMNSVKYIGEKCLYHNISIDDLDLNNLEYLKTQAFYYNRSIRKINLKNIREIEIHAFKNNFNVNKQELFINALRKNDKEKKLVYS